VDFNNTITKSLHSNEILVTVNIVSKYKVESSLEGVPEGIPKPIVLVNV